MNYKIFTGYAWKVVFTGLILFFSPVVYLANAQGTLNYHWQNVKIGGGGFVSGIITCPTEKNLIYIRTDVGGAYRYNAADTSWTPMLDWVSPADWLLLGTESIAIDPANPNCLYMACGMYTASQYGVVLRSTDKGDHFQRSASFTPMGGNDMGRNNGERLIVDPNKGNILYFGSRQDGLWTSADSAKTWSQITSFPVQTTSNGVGIIFVDLLKSSGTKGQPTPVLYAGVSRSADSCLYFSEDTGQTWKAVPGQPVELMPQHCAIEKDSILFVTYSDSEGPWGITSGEVWRYNIYSRIWTDITPTARNQGGFGGVTVDPQNPGTVMVSTLNDYNPHDLVFRSTDDGNTWVELLGKATFDAQHFPIAMTNTIHWTGDLQIDPFNPDHVLINSGFGVWSTFDATDADNGKSTVWKFCDKGIEETVPLDLACPDTSGTLLLSAIGDFDGFRHSSIDSFPSRYAPNIGTTPSIAFASLKPNIVVRVGDGTAGHGFYSGDGGRTWTVFSSLPTASSANGTIAVSADGSAFVWAPAGEGVYYSLDMGKTWTASTGAPAGARPVADKVNAKKFYICTTTAYRSSDYGATFSQTYSFPIAAGQAKAVPGRDGDVWAALPGMGLYHSANSTTTFSADTSVQDAQAIAFGKAAPGAGYPAVFLYGKVGGVTALFRSGDEGTTWHQISDSLHLYGGYGANIMAGDPHVFGRIFVSTGGRGIICGEAYDCNGDLNGTAYFDKCNICAGGNTGITPCNEDKTAVPQTYQSKLVSLSPNPFRNTFQLSFQGNQASYNIINASGQVLDSGVCSGNCELGSNLAPGFYIISVKTDHVLRNFKVSKCQ